MPILTEWISVDGLLKARNMVEVLKKRKETRVVTRQEILRIRFIEEYIDSIDKTYGMACIGPMGHYARPLQCVYSQVRQGRLYCQTRQGPKWEDGVPSYVCAQGMPSALRPVLMGQWGRDIDIENCHVVLMYQLSKYYHLWPEHNGQVQPLNLCELESLATKRNEFFRHVADVHFIEEPIKENIKPLFLRILYGGTYDTWLKMRGDYFAKRSPKVIRLEQEIRILQNCILNSKRFEHIINAENTYQKKKGKDVDAVQRGAFSKVAQHLENCVLQSMYDYLIKKEWTVLSLIFDGLIVQDKPGEVLDLNAMADHVEHMTQFVVNIIEKPLLGITSEPEDLL